MFLSLENASVPMKRVYQLSEELKNDPEQVPLAQALTLDLSRSLGLKGIHGLFGSPQWWLSIERREMQLLLVSGVICRVYTAGQDVSEGVNSIEVLVEDGSKREVGIYVNDKADVPLFKVGCLVEIIYVLDELKKQPAFDGGVNYSKIALEMTVSLCLADSFA